MIIALDIGGTKIAAALMDDATLVDKRIIEKRSAPSPIHRDASQLLPVLCTLLEGWAERAEGIGIASTGLVRAGEVVFFSAGIEQPLPLVAALTEHFGLPVTLLNDAVAAAWGEFTLGGHGDHDALTYITVSTGIGGGLVHGGRLLQSHSGFAGHLGHTSVPRPAGSDEVHCGCGRNNCVEAYASGTAIGRRASDLLGQEISCQQVFMRQSEPPLSALLDDAAGAIAEMIANATAILDSPLVVIGGSVGLAAGFIDRIEAALQQMPARYRPQLRAAALSNDADLFGAAQHLQSQLTQNKQTPLR